MAGCATPTRSAGHAPAGATADPILTFESDHPAGADQAGETELQMCVRHVAEQEDRIARQDILVDRLRESRSPILDDALQLLTEMHGLLGAMRDHVARLSN